MLGELHQCLRARLHLLQPPHVSSPPAAPSLCLKQLRHSLHGARREPEDVALGSRRARPKATQTERTVAPAPSESPSQFLVDSKQANELRTADATTTFTDRSFHHGVLATMFGIVFYKTTTEVWDAVAERPAQAGHRRGQVGEVVCGSESDYVRERNLPHSGRGRTA